MTDNQRWFLEAYYKACYSSDALDWMQAALMAKQMYNVEHVMHSAEEVDIRDVAMVEDVARRLKGQTK